MPIHDRQYLLERLEEIAAQAEIANERLLHNAILLLLQAAGSCSFRQCRYLVEAGQLLLQAVFDKGKVRP